MKLIQKTAQFAGLGILLMALTGCDLQKAIDEIQNKIRTINEQCDTIALEFGPEQEIVSNNDLTKEQRQRALHTEIMVKCDDSGYTDETLTVSYPYLKYKTAVDERISTLKKLKEKIFSITLSAEKLIKKMEQKIQKIPDGDTKQERLEQLANLQEKLQEAKQTTTTKISNLQTLLHAVKRILITSQTYLDEKKRFASEHMARDITQTKLLVQKLQLAIQQVRTQQQITGITIANIHRLLTAVHDATQQLARPENQAQCITLTEEIRLLRAEVARLSEELRLNNPPPSYNEAVRRP